MLRRRRIALAHGLLLALSACEGAVGSTEGGTAGDDRLGTVLLADVSVTTLCDRAGAVEIQLRARRIGCEQPTPCTVPVDPPEIPGDRATCPSAEPSTLMGVAVQQSGRYYVDTVVRFATGDPDTACFAEDANVEVLVTSADIEAGADRILEATGGPCPEP